MFSICIVVPAGYESVLRLLSRISYHYIFVLTLTWTLTSGLYNHHLHATNRIVIMCCPALLGSTSFGGYFNAEYSFKPPDLDRIWDVGRNSVTVC